MLRKDRQRKVIKTRLVNQVIGPSRGNNKFPFKRNIRISKTPNTKNLAKERFILGKYIAPLIQIVLITIF